MKHLVPIICFAILLLTGCSGRPSDPRLLEISEKVSDSPKEMLARLDSIDVDSLKEADRQFHALMRIKALDKAYVTHTSDSVILRLIDYYSRHKKSGLYPEALYYGGRVYSDIGDAPTALRYFQEALDVLPEGKNDILRSILLSQIGSLLNSLRLHSEAACYLKKASRLFLQRNDSLNAMRGIQLLGAVYMHVGDYESAGRYFSEARKIGTDILHKDTVIMDMYLAGNEFYKGNISEALKLIRSVTSNSPERKRDIIYAYASQIYLEAGKLDTAYLFALKLLKSKSNDFRKNGYSLLLNPALRRFSSMDSLVSFTNAHEKALDKYLDKHDAQQVAFQTSLYNYQTHERERKKAEESMQIYMYTACGAIFFILVLCIVIMYLRNRNMKTLLQYRKALDDVVLLRKALLEESEVDREKGISKHETARENELQPEYMEEIQMEVCYDEPGSKDKEEKMELRERLKEELLALQEAGEAKKEVSASILDSQAYDMLRKYLRSGKPIPDSDDLWIAIEEEVLKVSPMFKTRLYLLVGDRLKKDAYYMALLVKCGMTPTDLTVLMGRSKGAVSSRRGYICEMIFGRKLGAKVMDDIIRLL